MLLYVWYLWEIVFNTAQCSLICYFFEKQLGHEGKSKIFVLLAWGALIVWFSVVNFLQLPLYWSICGVNIYLTKILILITIVLYSLFAFSGSMTKRIILGIVPTVVISVADSITSILASSFSDVNLVQAAEFDQVRFPLTISYILVCAILYFILANVRPHKAEDVYLPLRLQVVLFIVLFIGVIAVDQLIDVSFILVDKAYIALGHKVTFVNFALLVILIVSFVLFELIGRLARVNIEYALEIHQSKLENSYYKDIEKTMDALRDVRHDMNGHIQTMLRLLRDKNNSELEAYFVEMAGELEMGNEIIVTSNATVNALLTSKIMIARSEHILVNHSFHNLGRLPTQSYKICSLLGNLLDNAIEACRKIEDESKRFINLNGETKNDMIIIEIENSSNGKYLHANGFLLSDKKGEGHGLGLRHVRKIVKGLGGTIQIKPGQYEFIVSVMLPMY